MSIARHLSAVDDPDDRPARPGNPPWERQPEDTDKSWEAFVAYRDLGLSRTLPKTMAKIGKSSAIVRRWSSRYHWAERARAYDAHLDGEVQTRMLNSRHRMAERHAMMARRGQQTVLDAMALVDATILAANPALIPQWLRVTTQIERESYFPKDAPEVSVGSVTNILIDPILVPPPTRQVKPRITIDAKQEETG